MKDDEIRKYIDMLNSKEHNVPIFLRQISHRVDVAKIWPVDPKEKEFVFDDIFSYRLFFIKNPTEIYVGAVLDMDSDLHWYVLPEYRKQGFLTKALMESILPYLFYDGRTIQNGSIDKWELGEEAYINSKNVALSVGFKPVDKEETKFELNVDDFNWEYETLSQINSGVSHERFVKVCKKVNLAYQILLQAKDELQMGLNTDCDIAAACSILKSSQYKLETLKFNAK